MKSLIKYIFSLLVFVIFMSLSFINFYPEKLSKSLTSFTIERNQKSLSINEDEITVFTMGTGSPLNTRRVQSGTAVFIKDKFFIFDVGEGVVTKAEEMTLPLNELDAVFITHFHSDHYIDLPYLINRSWVLGRNKDLNIYGPEGLKNILDSNYDFLKLENKHRVDHHGSEIMNTKYAYGVSNEFKIEDNKKIIYDSDEIKITAFNVDHYPVEPSVGYAIEYNNKKVVISGDTKANELVFEMATNADLLIHEAILNSLLKNTVKVLENKEMHRNSHIVHDIQDYHTPPNEIVKLANIANVKTLVLHHLTPSPDNIIINKLYEKQIKDFNGKVYLAKDGDKFIVK